MAIDCFVDRAGTLEWWPAADTIDPGSSVFGYFTHGTPTDAIVVWGKGNNGWRQVWPEPRAPRSISVGWAPGPSNTLTMDSIQWTAAADEYGPSHVPVAGDLNVWYTARVYWNDAPGDTSPVDNSGTHAHVDVFPGVGANGIELAVQQPDKSWTFPAPQQMASGVAYCVEVTAHWLFYDGSNPVEQPVPVSRTSFIRDVVPDFPVLPAPPNIAIEWITDTAISKGTRTGEGHFRNAPTVVGIGSSARAPVPATKVWDYPAMKHSDGTQAAPALTGSSQSTRTVAVKTTTGVTRPAVPAATKTVYDFAAVSQYNHTNTAALRGSSSRTRTFTRYAHKTGSGWSTAANHFMISGLPSGSVVQLFGATMYPSPAGSIKSGTRGVRAHVGPNYYKDVPTSTPYTNYLTSSAPATWLVNNKDTAATYVSVYPTGSWGSQRLHVSLAIDYHYPYTQTGTARSVKLPWDGVAGHAGDPGANTTHTVTNNVVQKGTLRTLPWSGVPGEPGDPGTTGSIPQWSWPYNLTFDAVPGAGGYEMSANGAPWEPLTVPASATGASASGTVTISDHWSPISPLTDMTVRVRAVKPAPSGQAGFIASVTDEVPEYPTIGPVTNLAIASKGWRYALATWGPPVIDPAATHYLSGNYRYGEDATHWAAIGAGHGEVDKGNVALPAHGPYEETTATPAGAIRLSTGRPRDPGPPGVDQPRQFTIHAEAQTGWRRYGPDTQITDDLLPRIDSWTPQVLHPSHLTAQVTQTSPTTYTSSSAHYGPGGYVDGPSRTWVSASNVPAFRTSGITYAQMLWTGGTGSYSLTGEAVATGRAGAWFEIPLSDNDVTEINKVNWHWNSYTSQRFRIDYLDASRNVISSETVTTHAQPIDNATLHGRSTYARPIRYVKFTALTSMRLRYVTIRGERTIRTAVPGKTTTIPAKYYPATVGYDPTQNPER